MGMSEKLTYVKNTLEGEQNFIIRIESERLQCISYFFEVAINNSTKVVTIREKRVSDDGSHFYVDEEHKVGIINVQHFKNDMRYELTYEFDGNNYWLILRYNKGYLTIAKYLDNIALEDFTVRIDDEYDFGIVNFKNIMNQFCEFCCYCGLRQGTLKRAVRERLLFRKDNDIRYLDQFTYMEHDDNFGRMTLRRDKDEITVFINHNEAFSMKLLNPVCFHTTTALDDNDGIVLDRVPKSQLLVYGINTKEILDGNVLYHYMFLNYAYGNKFMITVYTQLNGKVVEGSRRNYYSGDYMNMDIPDVESILHDFLAGIGTV